MEEGDSSGGEADEGREEWPRAPPVPACTLYLQVLLEADGEYLSHGGA